MAGLRQVAARQQRRRQPMLLKVGWHARERRRIHVNSKGAHATTTATTATATAAAAAIAAAAAAAAVGGVAAECSSAQQQPT